MEDACWDLLYFICCLSQSKNIFDFTICVQNCKKGLLHLTSMIWNDFWKWEKQTYIWPHIGVKRQYRKRAFLGPDEMKPRSYSPKI